MRRVALGLLLLSLLPASAAADPPTDPATEACHGKSPTFLPTVAGCKLADCGDDSDGDESFQLSLGKDGVGQFQDRTGHVKWWAYGCAAKQAEPDLARKAQSALEARGWKIVYAGAPDQTDAPKDEQRADLRVITAAKGTIYLRLEAPDPDDEDEPSYSVTWLDGKEAPPCTHDCD